MDMITLAMAKNYTDGQRLAYSEVSTTEVFTEQVLPLDESRNMYVVNTDYVPVIGQEYIVTVNGIEYKLPAKSWFDRGVYFGKNPNDTVEEEKSFTWFLCWLDGQGTFFMWENYAHAEVALSVKSMEEIIRPIDPKFIPAMDSITLNGADGNQYKLTVDASGALAVTAV